MALSNDDYTVAWISALHDERASAEALLDEEHDDLPSKPGDDNSYTLGKIGQHHVVITGMPAGSYGTTSAATVAINLLRSFPNIRFGLLVGVGGGVPDTNDLRLGDVVVSTPEGTNGGLVQYDFGTAIQEKKFVIKGSLNKPPTILTNAIGKLRSKAARKGYSCWQHFVDMLEKNPKMKPRFSRPSIDDLYHTDYVHEGGKTNCAACSPERKIYRPIRHEQEEPLVFYGTIGSANQVLRDAKVRDELHQQTGIICFEMEAAGLMDNFPCIVIRGICDYADTHKNKEWQPYAGAVAAAFAKELVLSIAPNSIDHIPQANLVLKEVNKISVRQDQQAEHLNNIEAKIDLTKLPYVKGAAYNSFSDTDEVESRCLPGTRLDLLSRIREWTTTSSKSMFWLNGMAGTGKSTIARTIAAEFDTKKQLGASFFFKSGQGDRGKASAFFTTIATQLVESIPEIARLISKAVKENPTIADKTLEQQFKNLILQPLQGIVNSAHSFYLIVIDALDECDNEVHVKSIVKLLSQLQSLKTIRVKTLITSRPELPPKLGFRMISEDTCQDLILHRVEKTIISHDIALFFKHKFEQIRFERPQFELPTEWPGEDNIKSLTVMAVPLFIFATTVCRFIGYRFGNPRERLARVLKYQNKIGLDQMDQTYKPILDRILDVEDERNGSQQESIIRKFRDVIGPIVVLADYLSISSLANLLQMDSTDISYQLGHLHSVLDNIENTKHPIRPLHLSFPNYLLDPTRQEQNRFWIDETAMHKYLAYKCIYFLRNSKLLKQDICNLQKPGFKRSEVGQDILSKCIPPELRYACCYWVRHLKRAQCQIRDQDEFHLFLNEHFLEWLEVIWLLGRQHDASDMIGMIGSLRSLVDMKDGFELINFLQDARRFIGANTRKIRDTPLELYRSALVFAPEQSIIRSKNALPRWLVQCPLMHETWHKRLSMPGWHSAKITCVVFSHNRKLLASGSDDRTVKIWDVATGSLQHTLYIQQSGHRQYARTINSMVFSCDGRQVAATFVDKTIDIWDIATRDRWCVVDGNYEGINSVVISPNGKWLIFHWSENTVEIWDTTRRRSGLEILEGYSYCAGTVAFSSDGKQLASSSKSKTIKIWDMLTGFLQQTLNDDSSEGIPWEFTAVSTMAFSSDGKQLASGLVDGTVEIWNLLTNTLQQILKQDESWWFSPVDSVAFSPNGKQLASSSGHKTVEIWDATTGSLQQTIKVRGRVSEISFHPALAILNTNVGPVVLDHQNVNRNSVTSLQTTYDLWVKKCWIMNGNEEILYLRDEYKVYASMNQTIAIGTEHGQLLLFEFSFEKSNENNNP